MAFFNNFCLPSLYFFLGKVFLSINQLMNNVYPAADTMSHLSSVQFSRSVILTLCNPMNHSTPGLLVHHQLPEFTQTHVHQVGDTIQPPHPLSSPSLPAPNPSQHQGLFQWVNSSHKVAKVLEFQLQHQSFQWTPKGLISFRMDWLYLLVSRQEYWSGLPFPSPVDHILSDLSTMTHPSWVAPHGMA